LILALHYKNLDRQNFEYHPNLDPRAQALLQAQMNIGWPHLFQGRLATQWSQIQEKFLSDNNTKFKLDRRIWTGDIWARKLVSLIWTNIQEQCHLDQYTGTMAQP
jgi:hypothetical protein